MKNHLSLFPENEFITQQDEIIKEILRSKQDGNMIGIISSILGAGMYLTAVDDFILDDHDSVIILKLYDMNGRLFPTNKIPLRSVKAVCPFKSKFANPYLPKKDTLKDLLA